jgi:hypothetical protein
MNKIVRSELIILSKRARGIHFSNIIYLLLRYNQHIVYIQPLAVNPKDKDELSYVLAHSILTLFLLIKTNGLYFLYLGS